MMKNKIFTIIIVIFIGLIIFSTSVWANDMEFISEGSHIIPLEISDISIKKERLKLKKLDNYDMEVKVEFVFDSPSAGNRTIGFITPHDEDNDPETSPRGEEYNPKDIKNFKTFVNGKSVKINIVKIDEFLNKGLFTEEVEKKYKEKYSRAYVYYFKADLKKGENTVEHSYSYEGIYSSFNRRDYNYVLTTISRWKNKKVEDFEMIVDMGDEFFILPYTFWNDYRPINWEIVGEGRQTSQKEKYPNGGYLARTFVKMKKGYVRYRAKDFSPDVEFYMYIPMALVHLFNNPDNNPYAGDLPLNGYKINDRLMKIGHSLDSGSEEAIKEAEKLKDFELEIIRNFPFAVRGYDFSRKDLKDYFSQFFWYYPKGKVHVDEIEYKRRTEIVNDILKKRRR